MIKLLNSFTQISISKREAPDKNQDEANLTCTQNKGTKASTTEQSKPLAP